MTEIKKKSGRSYAWIATRTRSSPSAVHRYCTGAVVPAEFATVQRMAIACGLDPAGAGRLYPLWVAATAGGPARQEQPSGESDDDRLNLLPSDIADFTGREDETARLVAALTAPLGTAVPIAVITGAGGTGKTTLAVHVAHRLRDRFPGGRIFVDLSEGDGYAGLVRALDATGRADRAQHVRLLLSGRRVLLVLDDAAGAAQVRALLPGGSGCAVLVTGRSRMASLPGATVVELGGWDAGTSLTLLRRIAGEERIAAEPEAAGRVARLCEGLPLAVRIAGARLVARPHRAVVRLAERLADERLRLDELSFDDLDLRGTLAPAYAGLSDPARRLLHRLARLPERAGLPRGAADEDAVDELLDAWLLAGPPRYHVPSLVRDFVREASGPGV